MRATLPALLSLALVAACQTEPPPRVSDTFTPSVPEDPNADRDTEPDDTFDELGETDDEGPPKPTRINYVVTSITLAPTGTGHDLNGDGTIDNALGFTALVVNALIAGEYPNQEILAVLQTDGINDGSDGGTLGIFVGIDETDSVFTPGGTPTVTVYEGIDAGGLATQRGPATFTNNFVDVDASLPPTTLSLGIFSVPVSTNVRATGKARPRSVQLLAGGGISIADATTLINTFGLSNVFPNPSAYADLDTNNDGVDDTISAAFTLTGIPVTVVPSTSPTP